MKVDKKDEWAWLQTPPSLEFSYLQITWKGRHYTPEVDGMFIIDFKIMQILIHLACVCDVTVLFESAEAPEFNICQIL